MGNADQISLLELTQLLFLVGALVLWVFYLRTQYRILVAIQPVNRIIAPGLVWLQLIPVFATVWQFFVVIRLAISVRKERISRLEESLMSNTPPPALSASSYPGMAPGLTFCALSVGYIVYYVVYDLYILFGRRTGLDSVHVYSLYRSPIAYFIMVLMPLVFFAGAVACWIFYWINLTRIRRQLTRQATTPSTHPI